MYILTILNKNNEKYYYLKKGNSGQGCTNFAPLFFCILKSPVSLPNLVSSATQGAESAVADRDNQN